MVSSQSWDDNVYCVQDNADSRGAVAFAPSKTQFVGVFYYSESSRNPLRLTVDRPVDATKGLSEHLLFSLPSDLVTLKEQALRYVIQDVQGQVIPVVTAAFWCGAEGSVVEAVEPWSVVFEEGALLIERQFLSGHDALHRWQHEFEFDSDELSLVDSLFKRRIKSPDEFIVLTSEEQKVLRSNASGATGLTASREALAEMRIMFS
ncbi:MULTISPECIES: hypothetical protein [unclassified Bradyrhizobium]|uniref:hypothetical protein n=1 Tax=unclassified Bradyrhizobium TaxID=2631580 RepID=UPI0028E46646|nr:MULTISPECIES: hypothetical protein [unclassified Bradyrhizobium]